MMTEVIEIMYVFFHSIIFHGNASTIIEVLECQLSWIHAVVLICQCDAQGVAFVCDAAHQAIFRIVRVDASVALPNSCPFPAQMGGTCSAARQPLGRERRGHLCTSDRSLCERVRDDEMTR